MTPQPSALAALQRYNISGDCVLYLSINGYYFLADDVLAAWPTQDEQPYFDYNTVHGLHPAGPTQAQEALQRQFRDILNSAQESYGVGLTVELSKDDYEVLRKIAEQWRTPGVDAIEQEHINGRTEQAAKVMPLIGGLLDAWDNCDLKGELREESLGEHLAAIDNAMEGRDSTSPSPSTAALREALKECADDLEAEIEEKYKHVHNYPSEQARYERDIAPVKRASTLLAGDSRAND